MRALPRRDWDLWSIGILSLILILVIYGLPDNALRIIIGLPFILFFPGYSALSVLFPESKDLEIIERVALSFGLSIAISPLVGFGLNYTPFGIRLAPILFSLAALNIALSAGGLYRREKADAPYLPFDPCAVWRKYSSEFKAEKGVDKLLTVVLVISILSSVIALVYVVAVPRQGESFTEFYILGPGGNATGYPRNLTIGQDASVIIGSQSRASCREVHRRALAGEHELRGQHHAGPRHVLLRSFNVTLEHTDVDLKGMAAAMGAALRVQRDHRRELQAVVPALQGRRPRSPFASTPMMDYTGTSAEEDRIIGAVENEAEPEPEPEGHLIT